jgi:hypothetical protein
MPPPPLGGVSSNSYGTLRAPHVPHPAPEAEEVYRRWLQFLDEEFTRHSSPERRAEIVRDQLYQLYLGRPHGGKLNLTLTSELPGNVVSLSLDPENVTLEAEHFADADRERTPAQAAALVLADVRPLAHRPQPLAGPALPLHAGPPHFARIGAGVKIYHGVDLTYGYNLSIGDGVTIRQRALLNDRGGITIGKGASSAPSPASTRTATPRTTTARSRWCPPSSARRPHRQPRHRAGRPARGRRRAGGQLPKKLAGLTCNVRFPEFQQLLIAALCAVVFAGLFPQRSLAQQLTYYDFNAPQATPGQSSTACGSIAGGPAANGVLFCFNYLGADLSFIQDFYPPLIDPNANTDGDAGSTNYALQVTENAAGNQDSSMWYSIPQNVAAGFTVWYAVNAQPSTGSSATTADGLAFVIQNAAGGKTDSFQLAPKLARALPSLA